MIPSPRCLSLIMEFEGCSLRAYPDPVSPLAKAIRSRESDPKKSIEEGGTGVIPLDRTLYGEPWAIGLSGSPWTIGYGHTGPEVREGMVISPAEASRLLYNRVQAIGGLVLKALVRDPSQGQLDALTSLCYNIGQGAFRGSILLRLLNEKRPLEAANEFCKWDKAGGQLNPGLQRRREAEKQLFLS